MKMFKNKRVKAALVVTAGISVLYLAAAVPEIWRSYKWRKSVERFQNALEKPYREDVYGGKTPEETWAMFLDALKKGDIDLASKYYDVEHQGKAKEWLEGLKKNDEINGWIKDLKTLEKDSLSNNDAYFSYKYYDEDSRKYLWSDIVFYLNPYTKVWKIIF